MSKQKRGTYLLCAMAIYAVLSVVALGFALSRTQIYRNTEYITESAQSVIVTEYIYVFDESQSMTESETAEQVYTVREHMGRIGIFLEDGTLYETIDVYVRTLPEADRRLLAEGFTVTGKQALGEIVQDYGS